MPREIGISSQNDRTKEIIWLIRRIIRLEELYTKELNKKYQVSLPQLYCLLALYENGPSPPSQIAKYVMVNSSTVTGIIDRLEHKGLVERSRISKDRRKITITLTTAGLDIVKNTPFPLEEKILKGLKRLPSDEINQIVQALTNLAHMLGTVPDQADLE